MTTEAVEICCWGCSEYNVNFSYILNAIADLKKRKIKANFQNIVDKLNSGDDLNKVSEESLQEIIDYACETKYLSTYTYNIIRAINKRLMATIANTKYIYKIVIEECKLISTCM